MSIVQLHCLYVIKFDLTFYLYQTASTQHGLGHLQYT